MDNRYPLIEQIQAILVIPEPAHQQEHLAIVAFLVTAAASTTGSPTLTTANGYNVYKFNASGSITF